MVYIHNGILLSCEEKQIHFQVMDELEKILLNEETVRQTLYDLSFVVFNSKSSDVSM